MIVMGVLVGLAHQEPDAVTRRTDESVSKSPNISTLDLVRSSWR